MPFFALIQLLILHLASTHSQAVEWEVLPPLPAPNGGCLAGVIEDGRILVVGGTNWEGGVKRWLNTVHLFDPATKQWTTVKDALKTPVAYGLETSDGAHFGFIGGSDGTRALRATAFWSKGVLKIDAVPGLPSSLVLLAGGMVKNEFVLVGGMDDPAHLPGVTRETHVLNANGVARRTDYPGRPFAVAASVVAGNELLIFGGMNYDATTQLPVNTSAAYAYAPAKDAWRTLKPLAQPNRGLAAVLLDARRVYLAGGYTDDFTAGAVVYDVEADTYTPALPLPHSGMVKLVRGGDYVYCLGGEDKKQSRTDKCFRVPVADLLK